MRATLMAPGNGAPASEPRSEGDPIPPECKVIAAGLPGEAALLRDAMSEFFGHRAEATRRSLRELFRRGRLIGGWVAMWRPLEIFLYDWWPLRRDARGFDRLAAMPVRIVYGAGAPLEAWRSDWPAKRAADAPGGGHEREPLAE